MKSTVFNKEVSLIADDALRNVVVYMLEKVPDVFYYASASPSGRFHPKCSQGEGGLVRHTKLAIRWAIDLLVLEQYEELQPFTDEIVSALLIHDSLKLGYDGAEKTVAEHPLLSANYFSNVANSLNYRNKSKVDRICSCVKSHMGQWNRDYSANEILPKPSTNLERFVHLCDFLSSRGWLEPSPDIF